MTMKQNAIAVMTITIAMVLFSVPMVYSAGAFAPNASGIFIRQCIYAIAGLALLIGFARFDYRHFLDPVVFRGIVLASIALLVLVLFIGATIDGGTRWLRFGFLSFQPSEVGKFALILLLAVKMTQNRDSIHTFWRGFLPPIILTAFFAGLVVLQRDLGIPFIMVLTVFAMLYIAGARIAYLVACTVPVIMAIVALIQVAPHRAARISAFLDPWQYREETGWQLIQSLSAFTQGGFFGRGAGASEQKLGYLPAAHTDFIPAVIGEEFGLVGIAIVITLFIALSTCCFRIAAGARDFFGSMLASGIAALIGGQAAFILAVTTGLLPTKGLPLPFISYGGTALVVACVMMGVVVNIGIQAIGAAPNRKIATPAAPTAGTPRTQASSG